MVGLLIRETIALRRAYDCDHEWQKVDDHEEQCARCHIVVTSDGKVNLERAAAKFHGRSESE